YRYLNNKIYDNGYVPSHIVPTVSTPGQIKVAQGSTIYMQGGHNNVYSNPTGTTPEIPCLVAASLIPVGTITRAQILNVEGTYWGSGTVNDNFFVSGEGYGIDYDPVSRDPWGQLPSMSPYPEEPDSKSYDLLMKAIAAEFDGKHDKAIHFYEKIIDKYPDSEEATIAYAKLPESYYEEEMALEPLIAIYDENLESEDNINKKFFKEMKVATYIKGKKYDEAIAISEEMLAEADSEEEEILCEIDIAIAIMLKDNESKSGISSIDQRNKLNDLYSKLGSGDEEVKTDITETALPSEFALYQNYPNPFNPTTEISYALSQDANVSIKVYSSNGSLVADLVNASQSIGNHSVTFDASKLSNGIFYYSLVANGNVVSTKKMLLLK
ncbi:MAG: T9SS type A sorting domain-containing protein, partial [Candidatus Delongbacteria bacterium]|nr:T9SS type A sorting domain-containing protein [Candidatus Delongbacteria bacterium]